MKPAPLGIHVINPDNDPILQIQPMWQDANVKGVIASTWWGQIEPQEWVRNWTYIDAVLTMAQIYNKRVILMVYGAQIPQARLQPPWLANIPVSLWTKYDGSGNSLGTMAQPWDQNFLYTFSQMIRDCGLRYDGNPLVSAVCIWTGGTSLDCEFASTPAELAAINAAGGIQVWSNAATLLTNMWRAAFPNTQLYFCPGDNYNDNHVSMTNLSNYAMSLGMGLAAFNLSATFPNGNPLRFPSTSINCSQIPKQGWAFVAPLTSPRMNGSTMATALANGLACGAQWVAVYPGDPAFPGGSEAAMASFNQSVGAI